MKLSTRSRYGMRLMLDLALNSSERTVFLKDIAKEEQISEKYLSLIIIPLRSAGLIRSIRGAHGGYSLGRPASEISLKEIVNILEGGLNLVDCVQDPSLCTRAQTCASRDVWKIMSDTIAQALDFISLEDLANRSREKALNAGDILDRLPSKRP